MKKSFILRSTDIAHECVRFIGDLLTAEQTKNELWKVTITKANTRTIQQNKFYWSIINEIAFKKKVPKQALHQYLKATFLPMETITIDGYDVDLLDSTTQTDPKQMSDYIEKCIAHAVSEWDIQLERASE